MLVLSWEESFVLRAAIGGGRAKKFGADSFSAFAKKNGTQIDVGRWRRRTLASGESKKEEEDGGSLGN